MSELKVLSYLGNHMNIVNLLGACTVGGAPQKLRLSPFLSLYLTVLFSQGPKQKHQAQWLLTGFSGVCRPHFGHHRVLLLWRPAQLPAPEKGMLRLFQAP